MELKLEVVLSSSIKRKKPWPRFCWLGQERESVFLLDDKRISEINIVSGQTKKKTPKVHPLLSGVVTMAPSHNGVWLCGLLASGELFMWNRDKDLLKTAAGVPEVLEMITGSQGNATRLAVQVSGDGTRVLLAAVTGRVFLWECTDFRDLMGLRDGTIKGHWAHIQPLQDTILPSPQDKEASQHTIFVKTEAMGDACLSAFVFTSAKKLIVTCLKVQWEDGPVRVGAVGYSVRWATKTYPMSHFSPACQPVKSRGALVPAFSPDGQLLAIVLNQRQPKATQVLFVSTQNFVSISSSLGGCGSKAKDIPHKYLRSYWVGSMSWSPDGLFLACVLKRGSLLILAHVGGLLTLTSSGCNIDFGPAHFLPLHPLVTYWPPVSAGRTEASPPSSSMSLRDVLRQRYSVTWHPRLFYLIVSDGYMATVLRVPSRPSPALLLKALLKDTSKDLEKVHVKKCLESAASLNPDNSFQDTKSFPADTVISAATEKSALPLFLQDQGTVGGTKELLEKVQTFFEDDSDMDGPPAGSHIEDAGRLEFASMFDTLHALDTHPGTSLFPSADHGSDFAETDRKIHRGLCKIQSRLLTAWAFGMSLGYTLENRAYLLEYTLHCVVRFAALLRVISSITVNTEKKSPSFSTRLLRLLKALLSFLPWVSTHSDGLHCLGLLTELSKGLVRLVLTSPLESCRTEQSAIIPCQPSSRSLSTALLVLKLVSDSLDHTYSLQERTMWSSAETGTRSQTPRCWLSDVHHVPQLEDKEKKPGFVDQGLPVPQRPSSRLCRVWWWIYEITQQYVEQLKSLKGCDGWEEEQQQVSVIMSQIQAAIQATGEKLEEDPALLSYPGEHLFLCGSYQTSADTWRSQIWEESKKSCHRSVFQETRLCLALLYSLLFQYHLREAQEFGHHMAHMLLHKAGQHKDNATCTTADSSSWLPVDLHSDAAYAVIQTLGRFMASYFTNRPLHIPPPHNVAVLPPVHLPHAPSTGRLVPLCQEEVARAIRRQQISEVWTVDYALELLMLGGLLPETVWLAYHLGDWKTAASLSLAYASYCADHFDFTRFNKKELHLPAVLEADSIFLAELESVLGIKEVSQERKDDRGDKMFTDPSEGEDWDLLKASIQEILKASVMAGVNVLSSPLSVLLDSAKDLCSCLPALVNNGLYLPSPPLYCPQPSPNTQDPEGTLGQFAEVTSRHRVSGVLQRLLLLLRSARCCHPAAQWYISHLRRARHLLHKIKRKYCYSSAAEEEKTLPEGLMKFVTCSKFFKQGPDNTSDKDPDIVQTIVCFRELCGLCWMLHVRDQLSISCRKYQAARQRVRDEQTPGDSEVNSACVDALHWARRYLPFSHFLNAEEIVQDILLSLVSELPPVPLVADTLAHAFPEEEESVRVPLREKYNSLMQRLSQCSVLGGENEEANVLMMTLIPVKLRQRRKYLGRLQRNLSPLELHLWEEKEEEEEDRGSKHGMALLRQLSLGTSLSTTTLTDCPSHPLCSDEDTEENTSEAPAPDQRSRSITRGKKVEVKEKKGSKRTVAKTEGVIQEENQPGGTEESEDQHDKELPSLPVVGTWEFELEDEEYLSFLELFLSYVLEKDNTDEVDSGREPPLLKAFCSMLRERELHSITFDVLTSLHRSQREGQHSVRKHRSSDTPVFRVGCCHKPMKRGTTPGGQASPAWIEGSLSRTSLSIPPLPGLRTGRQTGLFGLLQSSRVPSDTNLSSPSGQPSGQPSERLVLDSSLEAVIELRQVLDPKLDAQFPELGRLLEWMLRWADRRVLLRHHGKKMKPKGAGGTADGVVIRVKASAPAVLTSLSLLERRYAAILGTDGFSGPVHVPKPQWSVSPALHLQVDTGLERESSVDTGYPGSANTPLTGLDHNLQQGELSVGSHTDEPQELTFLRSPFDIDQDHMILDAQRRLSSSQRPSFGDLDVTPEKEGRHSDSEGSEALSIISNESICTPEISLKLEDLDVSVKKMTTSLHVRALQVTPDPEPQAPPTVQPEAAIHTEPSDPTRVLFPTTPVDPSGLQPQTSTANASTDVPPLSTQTPPMRQRLGDDLFRLVQNINYLSLMDVLGASFSSLQLAQQNASMAQSNVDSSQPNVPPSHATNFIPQQIALPVQTASSRAPQTSADSIHPQFSQAPACTPALQRPMQQSTGKPPPSCNQCHVSNVPDSVHGAGVNYQELQPLSVQAQLLENQFRESGRLIPSSQGLLTTTELNGAIPSALVVAPSTGVIQSDTPSQVLGLKLLQLQGPQGPQQSPSAPCPQMLLTADLAPLQSHHPKLQHGDRAASKKAEEKKTSGFSLPNKQFIFNNNPPSDATLKSFHPKTREKSKQLEFPLLCPALPAYSVGQPVPHKNISFPQLHVLSSPRPLTFISAPMGETPKIKLLHVGSEPKVKLPPASSTQMIRLMSMEELMGLAIEKQNAEEARLQLRITDSPVENRMDPRTEKQRTAAISSISSKRQKRKEKASKTRVAFQPYDAIIQTQEPADEPVHDQPAVVEETTHEHDVAVQPSQITHIGSFDSSLTGQRLLDKAMSTAAELHAFASTYKRPPESHDAFTNTDPTCPPQLVDKSVSVQSSATTRSPESQSAENLQFSRDIPGQDTVQTPQASEKKNLDQPGRFFLSVLDLEDEMQHKDLLPPVSLGAEDAPPITSPPSSADLHVLATSALRNGFPAADPQTSVTVPEDIEKPITQTGIPEEPPSTSYTKPSREPEGVILQDAVLPCDSKICEAPKPKPSVGRPRALSTLPTNWFSSRLAELDAQLASLQNIADYLETDFSNSRTLVTTIERLTPFLAPDATHHAPARKKTVRLSVPEEALTQQSVTVTEPNAFEEEEENLEKEDVVHHDSSTPEQKPPFRYSDFHSHSAGPSDIQTTPEMKDESTGASGVSHVWENENLGQSELNDTAEILEELMKEGYLPQSELDTSPSQTSAHPSRQEQQQSRWTSQSHVRPENERREVRIWMRRKQRERHAAYQRQREDLREKEHKPFSSSGKSKPTNLDRATICKTKEEKDKVTLLEQYNQRTREAFSLASDFPTMHLTQPSSLVIEGVAITTRPSSAPPPDSTHRTPIASASKSQSGQAQSHLRPWTADVQGRHSDDYRRRLGLHRPVTSLPRDRMCQITRRGMLTSTRSHTHLDTASQNDGQHAGYQRKTGLDRSPSGGAAVERGRLRRRMAEIPGGSSREIFRLCGPEESECNTVLEGLLEEQDDTAVSPMDWLDNLSEGSRSNLSKIDWAAIERMVASEGP